MIHSVRRLRQRLARQSNRVRFLTLNTGRIRPPASCRLTCAGRSDGGGAQWLSVFSTIAFARHLQVPFVHTALHTVEHASGDAQAWSQAWNQLFDLEACGIPSAAAGAEPLPCDNLFQAHHQLLTSSPEAGLWSLRHAHQFSNLFPERLASLRPLIRQAYRPASACAVSPVPLQSTLVVHVRRGDVTAAGPYQERFTRADAVAAQCRAIQSRFPQLRHVLLLSASADPDLLALKDQGFHLDAQHDVFQHLHWMTQAAGLLIARSALSYLAGILNPALVFAEPFEHPLLPGWHRP